MVKESFERMNTQITSVTYSSTASEIPAEEYWLRIEQDIEEDLVTAGEVAEVIDKLYDLNPCYGDKEQTDAVPEESPTEEKLLEVAKAELDLEECKRLKSGTYTALVNIYRSHPDEPYTLHLDVGKVKSTVTLTKEKIIIISIEGLSSLKLDFPVKSGLVASWVGSVFDTSGSIIPPVIKEIYGNTLFWDKPVTGVLRAEFVTVYDVVEIEVPGISKYIGSEFGEPQDANILAFYHYQFYEGSVTAPTEDIAADKEMLAKICGWSDGNAEEEEDPEPETEPIEPVVYGCIEYGSGPFGPMPIAEPSFYAEKCCVAGNPNPCRTWKSPNPGGYVLPQEVIDKLTREWPGPIEFIALGPITPEGCGAIYKEQIVRAKNCCDEAEPIEWDFETSVEVMADNTSGLVFVTGGVPPYHWSVRGQGFALNEQGNLRDGFTDTPFARIFATDWACGYAAIEVTDGCSVANGGVRSTNGQWVRTYSGEGIPLCPIIGDCARDHVGDVGSIAGEFLLTRGNIKIYQLRDVYPPDYGVYTAATVYAGCLALYAEQEAIQNPRCADGRYVCNECFQGEIYTPCLQYAASSVYDPKTIPSCHINVFGWFYPADQTWFYAKAHRVNLAHTTVDEWRC